MSPLDLNLYMVFDIKNRNAYYIDLHIYNYEQNLDMR